MPQRRLRLAFFGTPGIAATVLESLLNANQDDVVAVYCQPDRPKGRGQKLEAPPVKLLAEARGLPVQQPTKLKDGVVAEALRNLNLDLAIVVAYGRILPLAILEAPRFGCWNIHASLLPRHRGASPIQHAILRGDPETGVTLMQLTEGLDEGPMLLSRRLQLKGTENSSTLTDALAVLGAQVLLEGLQQGKAEGLPIIPQDHAQHTLAPLIDKTDGLLDFGQPAEVLERKVRAFDPWPGTFVPWNDGPLKISQVELTTDEGAPATILEAGPRLVVATKKGALSLLQVQPPGKRPMSAADFLRGAGRQLRVGVPFGPIVS